MRINNDNVNDNINGSMNNDYGVEIRHAKGGDNTQRRTGRHDSGAQLPTPSPSSDGGFFNNTAHAGLVREWVEIWDYAGGLRFRGFVAEKDGSRALFIFFDNSVMGKDLKSG